MKRVDYIIVGFGLAGMALAHELEKRGKSFVIYDHNPDRSSRIIGGMYNPIILKRFTPAWKAHELLQIALPFYREIERKFNKKYIYEGKIRRILHSIEEQNNWMVASDRMLMSNYMVPSILKETVCGIKAPYGFGVLKNVGRVDGEQMLQDYKKYLMTQEQFIQEEFSYKAIQIDTDTVQYKEFKAGHIVFSEGSYLPNNPYFNDLPMRAAKGELLLIDVPGLKVDYIIKSGVFMVPFGKDRYVVGATYNWTDKSFDATVSAKEEIVQKLNKFLDLPYEVIGSKVGVRPTIKDRRPLLGRHPDFHNLVILNGLGTRGVILAPGLAKILVDHIEEGKNIPLEMNTTRFVK